LFIISIRSLASPKHALQGNLIGLLGMLFAIFIYIFYFHKHNFFYTSISIFCGFFIGLLLAKKIKLNKLPQTIAILNGLGGLSALLVSCSKMIEISQSYTFDILGLIVGGITFSGSVIAFSKLQHLLKSQSSYSLKTRLIIYFILISTTLCSIYLYTSYNLISLLLLVFLLNLLLLLLLLRILFLAF
jgi:NAD(P) transhydrogenase subunit beta